MKAKDIIKLYETLIPSFFIKPSGEIIEMDSDHLTYVIWDSSEEERKNMESSNKDMIQRVKREFTDEMAQDYSFQDYWHEEWGNDYSAESVVWNFIESSNFIRVYEDSVMVPDSGINQKQWESLQKQVNSDMWFHWNNEEFKVKEGTIKVSKSFKDIKKHKELI